MNVTMRRATPDDLPAIKALRLAVGWHAHDWALLDAMRAPQAAFFLVEEDRRLLAMGSGIAYGRLGIVGNMAVADGARRRGHGSRVLEAVIRFLEGSGATRLELFATDEGRLLYRRYGFEPIRQSAIARVPRAAARQSAGRSNAAVPSAMSVRDAGRADLLALAAFDGPRYGADRSMVLASALADPGRPSLLVLRDGRIAGYAVLRPAGARIGPWLADDIPAAAALLAALAAGDDAPDTLTSNLPGENRAAWAWLEEIGSLEPSDGRMARGPDIERRLETIYGNAIGALG